MDDKKEKVETPVKDGKAPLTIAAVKQMAKNDVQCCLLLLQAIHDDDDVLNALSVAIHGKYMNERHKKELDAQTKLKS